jgi:hypothetical protein
MKRTFITLAVPFVLLLLVTGTTFGNTFTLGAENGRILAPAGIGIELSGAFQSGESSSPLYDARVSYGILPVVTISGEFSGDFKDGYNGRKLIQASLSPQRKGSGYTIYTAYDLDQSKISHYGISLWNNFSFIYAYANLESRTAIDDQSAGLALTPGVNVNLGSRLSLAGEAEFKPENWSGQELRIGANYKLNRNITAKLIFETGLNNHPERTYQTGIAVEL